MKKLFLALLVLPISLLAQCGSIFEYGKEYKIPCDWDYLSFPPDTIKKQEDLFIKYINAERVKRKLKPLVYDESLYVDVATPQAIKMAKDSETSHTNKNVYECVTPLFYRYRYTNFAYRGVRVFQNSESHWNILMVPYATKIAVRIEIDRNVSVKDEGEVYVSVVME